MLRSQHLILNVDDDEGARYVKTRILQRAGFEVAEAAAGMRALDYVSTHQPDLVLLDVKLPDINGIEVCRLIKGDPATAGVLVLQTSAALTDRAAKVRGLDGGADNYLAAPIEADELVANINALLRLRRVQHELLESEERFRQMAESIDDVFWIFSPQERSLLYVSPAFESMWGESAAPLHDDFMGWIGSVDPEDRERVQLAFERLLEYQPYNEEFRIRHPDGTVRWMRDRGYPIKDDDGTSYRVARITSDITAMKSAEERTLYLSRHDGLTALPNRSMFHQELERAITEAEHCGGSVEVLLIDLDHFKEVNDSLGHHIGDALLRNVADRLRSTVRKTDLVARLGGDEFAVICTGQDRETNERQLAEKLIGELSLPYLIGGHKIVAGGSIGVTGYPADASDSFQLLQNADLAMYRAKSRGRNLYQFYTSDLDSEVKRRRRIEEGLRQALQEGRFKLLYQAQVNLSTGAIFGVEALLRWPDCPIPDLALEELVEVADETGLMIPIGEWTINEACRQAKAWQDAGFQHLRVGVNCTSKQLKFPSFTQALLRALDESGLEPSRFELEITERSLMENSQGNIAMLRALKGKGIYISVDDFGTGYSSLSYLKHFPVDALKIDRLFIRALPESPQEAAIVRAIIGMAHSLSMRVVAEGIEGGDQFDFLRSIGCDDGQGYYLSEPLSGGELTRRLRDGSISMAVALA